MTTIKKGEKFTERYGVESATIYKATGDTSSLKIPGPDHPLYDPTAPTTFDPLSVEVIDADGKMTSSIEVWSSPDEGVLWVLDGRGRFLNVQEVNRRRAAEGRELVKPYIVPFNGDEKAAIARVRIKNYHRRTPTPSGVAIDLLKLRNAGHSWESCAAILHMETKDPEQLLRKLLPLAYCIEEVREAIDAGEISRGSASKFGGTAVDGSKKLGKGAQLELLKELRAAKEKEPTSRKAKPVGQKSRDRVTAALTNGASEGLKPLDKLNASIVAATLEFVNGNHKPLKAYANIYAIVEEAMKPQKRGPKVKDEKEER